MGEDETKGDILLILGLISGLITLLSLISLCLWLSVTTINSKGYWTLKMYFKLVFSIAGLIFGIPITFGIHIAISSWMNAESKEEVEK
jgi:hypothetical protein